MEMEKDMESQEWVTNDPKSYQPFYTLAEAGKMRPVMTEHEWRKWRSQFVRGRPQLPPGSPHTVERLESWGLEGLYRRL
jgi:hypothetical protein